MLHEGKIDYWNTKFGFIGSSELGSVFFHSSKVPKQLLETLTLFDIVSFEVKENISPMNKGKLVAHHILIKSKGDFSGYDRRIGVLRAWNSHFGFIDYPTEGKKIFLFHTRLVFTTKIQSGQLIVFNTIKSTKGNTPLFAYFAYPLIFEKDIEFLKKEYSRHPIPGLKEYILEISQDINDKFELELIELEKIETGESFSRLIKVIKNYKEQFNYTPDWVLLSKYVSTTYLIQLREIKLINAYDIKIINDYFIKASANTKRLTALIIPAQDIVIFSQPILSFYENIKHNPVVLIEFQCGIKRFSALAFEAFDNSALAFGQQFRNLTIG
jgi:cold shock CspA family protein